MYCYCNRCGTRNGADANFCKSCGQKLDRAGHHQFTEEEFAQEDRPEDRVSDLMVQAFRAHDAGDLQAAILACGEALELRPESTSAHSLMGMLYEKQGDRAKAIGEFERVLELNPGSIADREKLEQLRDATTVLTPRRIISNHHAPVATVQRNPSSVLIAGAAVFFLVLGIGAGAVWMRGVHPAVAASGSTAAAPLPQPRQADRPVQTAQPSGAATNRAAVANQQINPYATWGPLMNQAYAQGNTSAKPPAAQPPAPVRQDSGGEVSPAAVAVPDLSRLQQTRQTAAAPPSSAQPPLRPDSGNIVHLPDTGAAFAAPKTANPAATTFPTPPKNPGKIEIMVTQDGPNGRTVTTASAGETNSSMDSRSRFASAEQAQLRGDYRTAVKEYLKAKDGAGDELPLIEKQIGFCFQCLDDKESAITHYTDAIGSYKMQIAAGRNVEAAKRGIQACEKGIRACQ